MTRSELQRFSAKVVEHAETGCHVWQGARSGSAGYGYMRVGSRTDGSTRMVRAHRLAYEHFRGPITAGQVVDHLCGNPACVNPDHLDVVTQRENTLRGRTIAARNAAKTHCQHGHEFTPENTLIRASGRRDCKTCQRDSYRRWRDRQRAAAAAEGRAA